MLLRNHHEAEDAVQQTFLSAYGSLLNGVEPRHPAAWLATIARNECYGRIEHGMRQPLGAQQEPESTLPDPVAAAAAKADLQALWQAIGELPRRQRKALMLREFAGLSYDELAVALGVSEPTVESLLFRARRELRARMRPITGSAASFAPLAGIREALSRAIGGMPDPSAGALAGLASATPLAAKLVTGVAAVAIAGGTVAAVETRSGGEQSVPARPATPPARAEPVLPAMPPAPARPLAAAKARPRPARPAVVARRAWVSRPAAAAVASIPVVAPAQPASAPPAGPAEPTVLPTAAPQEPESVAAPLSSPATATGETEQLESGSGTGGSGSSGSGSDDRADDSHEDSGSTSSGLGSGESESSHDDSSESSGSGSGTSGSSGEDSGESGSSDPGSSGSSESGSSESSGGGSGSDDGDSGSDDGDSGSGGDDD